jgi:hypothetical protein
LAENLDTYYVYGIVPGTLTTTPPAGVDGARVSLVTVGDVSALVSELPATEYEPATVESRLAELDWLSPRAVAHDTVVSWAGDQGGVIPFPMWVMFRDAPSLENGLTPRLSEFHRALDRVTAGREYSVRVFGLEDRLAALSPAVAQLESEIAKATPGQRYLLERKLDTVRQSEAREVSASVAKSIHEDLSKLSLGAVTEAPPKAAAGERSTAILNAAYLVSRSNPEVFQKRLTDLIHQFEPLGLRFEFTGPWPPYHFVGR